MNVNNHRALWIDGTLNSYTQVFFSQNKIMGVLLIIVTFLDPVLGASGLIATLSTNLLAWWLGFHHRSIADGSYGFNSLLVGLGLGVYYEPGFSFFALLIIASLITFLLTIAVSGVLSKYGLPYLSIPFLLALWSLLLASRQFEALGISERGVYYINELYQKGSHWLVNLYHTFNNFSIHESIKIYLKSLGAILFQFNIVSGIVVAVGLLIYSRIAFTLSLLGFFSAYLFYKFIGADITELSYSYIGFNFILSGIAIGAFFLIPSKLSYLWTILLTPAIVVLTSSLSNLFSVLQLGIYSLPFNLAVITFIYMIKLRTKPTGLQETTFQLYQPEKNLYEYQVNAQRYRNYQTVAIGLPVLGDWMVSQGPNGAITHKEDWKHAWDFVIADEQGKQFKDSGRKLTDYYCYNKSIVAPASGTVVQYSDYVQDNPIGESNLQQNWGNSIVIKHDEQLYSQISHIKQGSFKVKKGENVTKGQIIASCGNSGRSPEPHVHFQIQKTPHIGSKTLSYPLDHFLIKDHGKSEFRSYDYPKENDFVSGIVGNDLLRNAFHFLPGRLIEFNVTVGDGPSQKVVWEVQADIYNRTYLYCHQSKGKAYFQQDGTQFYFTFYEGKKKTLLYYFFLGAYKMLLGFYPGITILDSYPIYIFSASWIRYLQDFMGPFYRFMKARFILEQTQADDELDPEEITIESSSDLTIWGRSIEKLVYEIVIKNNRVCEFKIAVNRQKITAQCTDV